MVTVSEEELHAAQAELTEELGITVEGAAAASWAGCWPASGRRARRSSSSPAATPDARRGRGRPADGRAPLPARSTRQTSRARSCRSGCWPLAAAVPSAASGARRARSRGRGRDRAGRAGALDVGGRGTRSRSACSGAACPRRRLRSMAPTARTRHRRWPMWRALEGARRPGARWPRWRSSCGPARRRSAALAGATLGGLGDRRVPRPGSRRAGRSGRTWLGRSSVTSATARAGGARARARVRGRERGHGGAHLSRRAAGLVGPGDGHRVRRVVGQAVVFGLAHSGSDVIGLQLPLMLAMGVGGLLAGRHRAFGRARC